MGVALVDFAVRQRQADRAPERVVVHTDLALSPKSDIGANPEIIPPALLAAQLRWREIGSERARALLWLVSS